MKKITPVLLALSLILAVGATQAQTKTSQQKKTDSEQVVQKKESQKHVMQKHHHKAAKGEKAEAHRAGKKTGIHSGYRHGKKSHMKEVDSTTASVQAVKDKKVSKQE